MGLFTVNTLRFEVSRKAFFSPACRIINIFFCSDGESGTPAE